MGPIDQAIYADDGMLARDYASLALVRDMRMLLVDVMRALKDDPAPSRAVEDLMSADARIQ